MRSVNVHEAKTHLSQLGLLTGEVADPEDFDAMGREVVGELFEGGA